MEALADAVCPPPLCDQDDETLEVGEVPPLLSGGTLLCPCGLLPLLDSSFSLQLLLEDT